MAIDLTRDAISLAEGLANGEFTSVELTQACLDRIAQFDDRVGAFLYINAEGALETAAEADRRRAAGEDVHVLTGVPIALKDNIVTRGMPTTCASKILEGWLPPYDATVVERIKAAALPILGKTNLDEFAMGSSSEHSAFKLTHNPWDLDRVPGGSGGGSAAAVAAFFAPLALGSDTGGSIRQPAAVTGTVGAKPTYGNVSRYGLIAMASSMDQIGPVTRSVRDAAALQDLIGGYDFHDSTSQEALEKDLLGQVKATKVEDLKGLRVGIVKQLTGEGYAPAVSEHFEKTVQVLKDFGAEVSVVDCPAFDYAMPAYYLIMPAEVSSNLARFDGVRYGLRVEPEEGPVTVERVMEATRGAGFGHEVKRRILLGTFVLSAGQVDAYYGAAQKVRTLIQNDFDRAFEQVDVLISPTSPTTAFKLGEKESDPMAMYLNDVATVPANMSGVPGISIPNGVDDKGLPVGVQVLAPARQDALMYRVASLIEEASNDHTAEQCPAKDWKVA
ncbi:aspartyl/glutamyl-tRNA amidotransferase subunit A [Boudabousia liubingyangii]|uniref:Glutamyl-tRNA(Gln) amidotransferase subunit A n=1 Tax=Boudabousia liubingyangii TaxID=1921764 RepID=A0A1Q5PQD0_9ACTO|nr:Asp-tRNA(Asn)/Glu-tRNA(Gln) amidotransferase subunit GatA [Boudabousia liubingyangii]OKL46102.1 aspartyl/glutamyl-tRNA amidotransferase subunit A [Boudabousia liubingyangii]OKL49848.1 aspartyl/glutamyl-tRNA amidotransferase subunit A [Boudabousia liubingyangii]